MAEEQRKREKDRGVDEIESGYREIDRRGRERK